MNSSMDGLISILLLTSIITGLIVLFAITVDDPPVVDGGVLRVDFEDVSCFCPEVRQSCSRDGGISCVMR
jgi:hypothetical protein